MAINLDNFVNVSIKYHLSSKAVGNRETAVLIVGGTEANDTIYKSLAEFAKKYKPATDTDQPNELYYYGYSYFKNGGLKLLVKTIETEPVYTEISVTAATFDSLKSSLYTLEDSEYTILPSDATFDASETYYKKSFAAPSKADLINAIKALDMEYIVICSTASWDVMNEVAAEVNKEDPDVEDETMIWKKKLISYLPKDFNFKTQEFNVEKQALINIDTEEVIASIAEGLILKYGTPGSELSIAAYLSKINLDYTNSVQDYAYTTENIIYTYKINSVEYSIGESFEDNALVTTLLKQNINVDSVVVGNVRNLGGNQLNGDDLVNNYMLVLLNQTLTERLVSLLTKKIKYNSTGLSLIGAEISRELNRYLNNGYLTTDKSWTEDDLVYKGITIISKNSPLKTGFKYVILPFSVLTTEELKEHKLPPIYVLVADSYSIRKINIVGEVF